MRVGNVLRKAPKPFRNPGLAKRRRCAVTAGVAVAAATELNKVSPAEGTLRHRRRRRSPKRQTARSFGTPSQNRRKPNSSRRRRVTFAPIAL
jgi:hypothetical protein